MVRDNESTSEELNVFGRWRRYRCIDCGALQNFSNSEKYRKKRLQCLKCGSYYLEPSNPEKEEQLYKNQRLVQAETFRKGR